MKEYFEGDGIGWTVCAASVVINLLRAIPSYTFGVFIVEYKRIYDRPMAELDWIGVLAIFFTDLFAPIPTVIIQKVGAKGYAICSLLGSVVIALSCILSSFLNNISWLFLTFSLLNGFGSALIMISSTLIVNEFFPSDHKRHVLATSLFQCSYSASLLFFTPFYAWIIKISSWREAFLIQGSKIFVIGCICSFIFLLKKNPSENVGVSNHGDGLNFSVDGKKISKKEKTFSDWTEIFKTPQRICWLVGMTLAIATQLVLILNLPHYMEHKGYNKVESSLPSMFLGIFELVTYALLVPLGSKMQGNLVYLNILSCFSLSIILFVWLSISPSYAVIMIFASALGCNITLSFGFVYAASKEVMEMEMDLAWTASCFFMGFGSLINPLISGLVFDMRNSYDDVLCVVGLVSILNGVNFCAIPYIQIQRKRLYENLE